MYFLHTYIAVPRKKYKQTDVFQQAVRRSTLLQRIRGSACFQLKTRRLSTSQKRGTNRLIIETCFLFVFCSRNERQRACRNPLFSFTSPIASKSLHQRYGNNSLSLSLSISLSFSLISLISLQTRKHYHQYLSFTEIIGQLHSPEYFLQTCFISEEDRTYMSMEMEADSPYLEPRNVIEQETSFIAPLHRDATSDHAPIPPLPSSANYSLVLPRSPSGTSFLDFSLSETLTDQRSPAFDSLDITPLSTPSPPSRNFSHTPDNLYCT